MPAATPASTSILLKLQPGTRSSSMRVSVRRAAVPASHRFRSSHGFLEERLNESSARSAAKTSSSSHAPGSKYGGIDQAQGHA